MAREEDYKLICIMFYLLLTARAEQRTSEFLVLNWGWGRMQQERGEGAHMREGRWSKADA